MLRTPNSLSNKRGSLKIVFVLLAVLLGAVQAWANRYKMNPDGISYLDIADAYSQGRWTEAVNAYWSPLYSWLLGLALFALKPSAYWEFPVVHMTNFLIYLVTLACFEFFFRQLLSYYQAKTKDDALNFRIPEWAWIVSGYTLFIWSSLIWITLFLVTPDMCVAALVYLAAGIILRIHTRSGSWLRVCPAESSARTAFSGGVLQPETRLDNSLSFVALGVVLGLGYLAKAVMFPLALIFLAVGLFSAGDFRRALPRLLVALLVFSIIVAPLAIALSTAKGRPTFGDSGKLNYAWLISGVRPYPVHWQGEQPESGVPEHPTRKIFDHPAVFEFGTPIPGTYPPWYDPAYWHEGITPKFNFLGQIRVLAKSLLFACYPLLPSFALGYLVLVRTGRQFSLSLRDLLKSWRLMVPAIAGLGIYLPVLLQPRYIPAFVVLLWAGVFASVRSASPTASAKSRRWVVGVAIALLLVIPGTFAWQASEDFVNLLRGQHTEWQAAEGLQRLGLQPGEKVASVGTSFRFFWARLGHFKVVAEIPDEASFWQADPKTKSQVFKAIEGTGAKVLVAKKIPSESARGWQHVGRTDYSVYLTSKR